MKRKWWGALVILTGGILWLVFSGDDGRLLWTRSYGANRVHVALSSAGQMVVASANRVEVLSGDGTAMTLLTRPSDILSFVDQHDTGFLIIDWSAGREWLRKYSWNGELLWERAMTGSLRQIKASEDGHFVGVINNLELALFDPSGALLWKLSEASRRFECLGLTSPTTIAYRAHDTEGPDQYASKTIHVVDLDGNSVNDAQLMDPQQVPHVAGSGMIAALEGAAVALFNREARHLWTRSKHDTMPAANQNSFMERWRLVDVSPRTNVFVEQPNGSISMYDSTGELAWIYANINQMPTRRTPDEPTGEDVLLFVHPDAFLSTIRGGTRPLYLQAHTWIANLNSDGSLKWKHQIRGSRRWLLPRSLESLRIIVTKGALQNIFYPIISPLRDRDGVVYAVGFDRMDSVVHAFRGD